MSALDDIGTDEFEVIEETHDIITDPNNVMAVSSTNSSSSSSSSSISKAAPGVKMESYSKAYRNPNGDWNVVICRNWIPQELGSFSTKFEAAQAISDYERMEIKEMASRPLPVLNTGYSSGIKGVNRSGNKWACQTYKDGEWIYLGRHVNLEKAAEAIINFEDGYNASKPQQQPDHPNWYAPQQQQIIPKPVKPPVKRGAGRAVKGKATSRKEFIGSKSSAAYAMNNIPMASLLGHAREQSHQAVMSSLPNNSYSKLKHPVERFEKDDRSTREGTRSNSDTMNNSYSHLNEQIQRLGGQVVSSQPDLH